MILRIFCAVSMNVISSGMPCLITLDMNMEMGITDQIRIGTSNDFNLFDKVSLRLLRSIEFAKK